MVKKDSKNFWVVSGLIILNLVIFIAISGFFLTRIHHHWILPTASVLIAIELALAELLTPKALPGTTSLFRKTLLLTLLFFCLVGAARYYTIFTCYQICGLKLGLMYEIAAGVFAYGAFRFYREGSQAWAKVIGWIAFGFFITSILCFFVETQLMIITPEPLK